MKNNWVFLVIILVVALSCKTKQKEMVNPFFTEYETPFQVPPFDQIKLEHYLPALDEGIKQAEAEIQAIVDCQDEPTFENTILALDQAGELLDKVTQVFYPLNSSCTNAEMQKIAREFAPKLSEYSDNISLNPELFKRIKAVYEKRNESGFDAGQIRVVEKYYQDFERGGANLPTEKQEILRDINTKLSTLGLQFGENLLAETNTNFRLVIEDKKDLAGLSEDVVVRAAEQAKKDSMEGKWVFTLAKPSMLPFLQYAENRSLREKLYRGYFMRGNNNNDNDNKNIVEQIAKLRQQRSELFGYKNYAEYRLEINMAKNPQNVNDFLMKLWKPALKMAKQDVKEMQAIINREGGNFKLASWDWWYYAEKLRKEKYDLDENDIKPYFKLENVRDGMFYVANKLYGITFEERSDIPVYHEEATAYEVKEADGSHIGVFYTDFHPRDGKKVGAWCTSFRGQSYKNGEMIHPIVPITMNFTRPAGDAPALLSFDEVTTMFHEFGHALHGLFTDGLYNRTAGSVPRDFVELPSQIMENWAADPEVMKVYAKHYETGSVIPDELIDKIVKSGHFNQGFTTGEYVAASLLDMAWHTKPFEGDVNAFEKAAMDEIGLIKEFLPRYRSTYFGHIFSGGGYASGYYVYIWAAQLDTDAYKAFKETGDIFNPELAAKFRELLAKSGDDEGMNVYRKFRGKDATIDALLEKRGLR